MKAVILASGEGKRLMPLTDSTPKPLVNVAGKTIIDYQMDFLLKMGIRDFIVTTGHLSGMLEKHLKEKYPDSMLVFVHNPDYRKTNYIYSLWLARELIDDDIILLHSDLVFDEETIEKIMEAGEKDCVLLNREIQPPEKDFKALVEGNRISRIGVKVRGPNAFFCLPVYKLSAGCIRKWMDAIGKMIETGKKNCYAEDALNEISGELDIKPVYFSGFGMEIDDFDDLEKAEKYLKANEKR